MTAANIIPATTGKFQKVYSELINSSNNLVNIATSDNQTNGDQKTQIVDAAGDVIDDTNPLPILLQLLSNAISSNSNTQLNITPFHADGTEGNLITGVSKVSGKDGIDSSTNTLQFIDYAHHEIHSGSHYFYREPHSIAKNGTVDHLIVTPNTTKWAHLIIAIEALSSSVSIQLYEGTVTSNNGTPQTPRNRNRNFPDNNTTLVFEAPTITTIGTLIASSDFGAGKNSAGGGARDSEEIVLKQNTKYLLRVNEDNIQATMVNIILDWYEHTNKN